MCALGGMARGGGCGFGLEVCVVVPGVSRMIECDPGGGGGASVICITKPFVLPNGGNMSNSGKPALGFVLYLGLPFCTGRLIDDTVVGTCKAVSEAIKGKLEEY